MLSIGLTGGIGSGKSTVAALLVAKGAVLIDADLIAREVVARGSPGLTAVVAEFGPEMLTADGDLDRPALAAVVFTHDSARARLNGIVHPLIGVRTAELTAAAPVDAVLVHDMPLLVEGGLADRYDLVLVVATDPEMRVRRLVRRGLTEADARARMASQATDEQRRAVADRVLDNDGTEADLAAQVDRVWEELVRPRLVGGA